MKKDPVEELQKIISESSNIVFFGGAGVSTESGYRISAVWTVCTISSGIILRR